MKKPRRNTSERWSKVLRHGARKAKALGLPTTLWGLRLMGIRARHHHPFWDTLIRVEGAAQPMDVQAPWSLEDVEKLKL